MSQLGNVYRPSPSPIVVVVWLLYGWHHCSAAAPFSHSGNSGCGCCLVVISHLFHCFVQLSTSIRPVLPLSSIVIHLNASTLPSVVRLCLSLLRFPALSGPVLLLQPLSSYFDLFPALLAALSVVWPVWPCLSGPSPDVSVAGLVGPVQPVCSRSSVLAEVRPSPSNRRPVALQQLSGHSDRSPATSAAPVAPVRSLSGLSDRSNCCPAVSIFVVVRHKRPCLSGCPVVVVPLIFGPAIVVVDLCHSSYRYDCFFFFSLTWPFPTHCGRHFLHITDSICYSS